MSDYKMENFLIKALLAISASATITGMLSTETLPQRIKTFIAGLAGGGLVIIICSETKLSNVWVLVLSNIMTSFVTIIWPLIGDIAHKILKKKGDDIVSNS